MESAMQPEREPSISESPAPQAGEPGPAPGGALNNAWESPQQCQEESQAAPWDSLHSAYQSPIEQLGEPGGSPGRALRATWKCCGLQSLCEDLFPRNLGMDCCVRSQGQVVPQPATSETEQTLPPRRRRVNGWSRPLHRNQAVAWATVLILAIPMFGIFIPMLPRMWKSIAYGLAGGILMFYFIVYVICATIDPAVNTSQMDIDRAASTIFHQPQQPVLQIYCSVCRVTVSANCRHCRACNKCIIGFDHHCPLLNNCVGSKNYWWFFSTLAAAVAWLLCLMSILLFILIQFHLEPADLRTDPSYENIHSQHTWLLFLPYFQLKAKTPVIVAVWVFVLMLNFISLLLATRLFVFHLYLTSKRMSTYSYLTQNRKKQSSDAASSRNIIRPFII